MTTSPQPAPRFRRAEVRGHGGVPTLHVDGLPIHGMTATSTAFDDPAVIEAFVRGGAEVMMIWIEAPLRCWRGPGVYDWSYAEEVLTRFERHAGATHWLIRVRLGLVAAWFGEQHPGEVHQVIPPSPGQPHGMAVSVVHSSIWLDHVTQVLRDFVTWVAGTRWASRVIGFMLNAGATEEWLPFDVAELTRGNYHPVYQREFRRWLRATYGDVDALNAAWSARELKVVNGRAVASDAVDFDTASCPTGHVRKGSHIWGPYSLRDPREDRAAIDYYRFLAETLADALIACCRAVKEAAGTPIVCGGFHSYLWWESGVYSYIQEYGHGLIQRLNASPWIDFVSDITSYDCRYPGGPSGYLGLPQSLALHGKLHYTEVDLVTLQSLPDQWRRAWAAAPDTSGVPPRSAGGIIPERVWNWSANYCGRDVDEQLALFRREHVRNLVSGTPYWWFDIRGRDYARPEFVDELARLSTMGRRAIGLDRTSAAEVAFVCSETTPFHQGAMNGEMVRFELESVHGLLLDLCNRKWGMAGVPFDCYEIADLAHADFPGERYKLIVFVNCAHIPQAAEAGIRRWQGGGRTMCWTYAAGVVGDDGIVAERSADLIGTRLGWRCERQQIRVQVTGGGTLADGGSDLDFGTEGSVGPVFFADDPHAEVLGRLRDGGEAAYTVRDHGTWRSVYLAMVNFGPRLLRNLADASGAHVWSRHDDAVYACRSLVGMHTASGGRKRVALPRPMIVEGEFGAPSSRVPVSFLEFDAEPRRTYAWWVMPG